jgi:formiminotetrahydrofolate cyclodeaminase
VFLPVPLRGARVSPAPHDGAGLSTGTLKTNWITMDEPTKRSLDAFLDQTADRAPTPGGGSVAGAAGALSCALARMVVAYSVTRKALDEKQRAQLQCVAQSLRHADEILRRLIGQDIRAYEQLSSAGRRKKAGDSSEEEYESAVLNALAVPMELATIAGDVLSVLDDVKASLNPYLLSDLGAVAVLAWATAAAARYMVLVNARELGDKKAASKALLDAETVLGRCAERRDSIESFVHAQLKLGS